MEFIYEGISIGYSICGSGPDLLLLHGWGCTRSVFDAFLPSLSQSHRASSPKKTGIPLRAVGSCRRLLP